MKVEDQHHYDQGLTIEELTVGQSYEKTFTITAELVERFKVKPLSPAKRSLSPRPDDCLFGL